MNSLSKNGAFASLAFVFAAVAVVSSAAEGRAGPGPMPRRASLRQRDGFVDHLDRSGIFKAAEN